MSSKIKEVNLAADYRNMDELPGSSSSSSSSKQGSQQEQKGKENEEMSGKGGENGEKQELRSPKTIPMLPPEVWTLSLSYLSEPTEFLAVINTCEELNELLHSKKTKGLMPLVLPLVMDYLPLKDCLPLRLANKNLKEIVDSTFQRFSTHPQEKFEADLELNGEYSKDKKAPSFEQMPIFKSLSRGQILTFPEAIQSVYSNTTSWLVPFGNPFMLGHVHLQLELLDSSPHLRSVISRFGMHISSLTIRIRGGFYNDPDTRMVNLFLELLSMDLPNLKKLGVSGSVKLSFVPLLKQRILPDLNKLEALDLSDFYLREPSCENSLSIALLQKYGSQLKVFHCGKGFFSAPDMSVNLLKTLLPNVRCLETQENFLHVPALQKLSEAGCKLEQLVLHGDFITEFWNMSNPLPFVNVIRAVNYFAETLTHLKLCGYLSSRTEEEATRAREEMKPLPKLKKLTVSQACLGKERLSDFIRESLPSLQQLCLEETWSLREGDLKVAKKRAEKTRSYFGMGLKLSKIVLGWYNTNIWADSRITLRRNADDN